jgi:hypothetical protein
MATVFYVDGRVETLAGPLSLEQLQTLVGGYIEMVTLQVEGGVRHVLFIDEEGKLKGKPMNTRATVIHQAVLRERGLPDEDWIVGDVVLAQVRHEGTDEEQVL